MNILKSNKIKVIIILVFFIVYFSSLYIQLFSKNWIGIANNGDFERLSKTVGIFYKWNPLAQENTEDSFWAYVVQRFDFRTHEDTGYYSTAQYTVGISKIFNSILYHNDYDIRSIGFTLFIILTIGILILIYFAYKKCNVFSFILFLLSLLLIVTDGYILQYFNSFYAEASSFVYFILLTTSLILLISEKKNYKLKVFFLIISLVCTFLFVCSKFQNILAIIPISILLITEAINIIKISNIRNIFAKIVLTFIVFLFVVVPSIYVFVNTNTASSEATTYSIIMADLLRLSKNPEEQLTKLGYSEEEVTISMPEIGKSNWAASPKAVEIGFEKLTRISELKVIFNEPIVFFKVLESKSELLFKDTKEGNYTKEKNIEPYTKSTSFRNFTTIIEKMKINNMYFYLGTLFVSILGYIYIYRKKAKYFNLDMMKVLLCLAFVNILLYITTLFGDYTNANIKQLFMTNVTFYVIILSNISMITYFIVNTIVRKKRVKKKGVE